MIDDKYLSWEPFQSSAILSFQKQIDPKGFPKITMDDTWQYEYEWLIFKGIKFHILDTAKCD